MPGDLKKQHDNWFEERMNDLGISQKQLADFVGVDQSTISRYSKGLIVPKLEPAKMLRLCVGLNIYSIEELVTKFQPDQANSLHELRKELDRLRGK